MAPTKKYDTEEERIEAYKAQQNNYAKKEWYCNVCDCVIRLGNKTKHLKSLKHKKNQALMYCENDKDSDSGCSTCDEMRVLMYRN